MHDDWHLHNLWNCITNTAVIMLERRGLLLCRRQHALITILRNVPCRRTRLRWIQLCSKNYHGIQLIHFRFSGIRWFSRFYRLCRFCGSFSPCKSCWFHRFYRSTWFFGSHGSIGLLVPLVLLALMVRCDFSTSLIRRRECGANLFRGHARMFQVLTTM